MRARAILRRRAYLRRVLRPRLPRRAELGFLAGVRCASGQATVEVVALVPIVAAVALAICALLAAGQARELAGHAATAGAMAILQGDDPERAARAAAPGWPTSRMDVRVSGRRVRVRIRPRAPFGLPGGLLQATATADAGPRAAVGAPAGREALAAAMRPAAGAVG